MNLSIDLWYKLKREWVFLLIIPFPQWNHVVSRCSKAPKFPFSINSINHYPIAANARKKVNQLQAPIISS